jgi:hypothetical protein
MRPVSVLEVDPIDIVLEVLLEMKKVWSKNSLQMFWIYMVFFLEAESSEWSFELLRNATPFVGPVPFSLRLSATIVCACNTSPWRRFQIFLPVYNPLT